MKKKFTPQSTFSNVGVFTGLLAVLVGLFLLVPGLSPNASAGASSNPGYRQGLSPLLLEQKVTASDGTTNSYFGSSDALNGPTAIIGADGDNSFQGAAYVFSKSNGLWTQGQKLTASDGLPGDEFGYRVALGDTTLVAGAFTPPLMATPVRALLMCLSTRTTTGVKVRS